MRHFSFFLLWKRNKLPLVPFWKKKRFEFAQCDIVEQALFVKTLFITTAWTIQNILKKWHSITDNHKPETLVATSNKTRPPYDYICGNKLLGSTILLICKFGKLNFKHSKTFPSVYLSEVPRFSWISPTFSRRLQIEINMLWNQTFLWETRRGPRRFICKIFRYYLRFIIYEFTKKVRISWSKPSSKDEKNNELFLLNFQVLEVVITIQTVTLSLFTCL